MGACEYAGKNNCSYAFMLKLFSCSYVHMFLCSTCFMIIDMADNKTRAKILLMEDYPTLFLSIASD